MFRYLINTIFRTINFINFKKENIKLSSNATFNGIVFVKNYGTILIGKDFKATSGSRYNPIGGDTIMRLICRKNARIEIGNNVGISNATLHISNSLVIEDNVRIGGGCRIWDSDFHSLDYQERIFGGDTQIVTKPIYIGKNAFVGAGSIILKGVRIGENSIVGAGSVVTKSIPDNEIWAGNPAKKIKDLI
jgi:acetyltransferase-like isoleucine patch superfamily enzyme